jgi:choline dehydrogenase-like flavoprotein
MYSSTISQITKGAEPFPADPRYTLASPTMPQASATYDYIVVGAGSAGCVLAARLSEDLNARVLLLEAGGDDSAKEVRIPAAFSKLFKSARDWNYSTEEELYLDGRRLYWPRGKMLGGSSSMNAMIYIRGNPSDYEGWENLGNAGWGWQDVLPYFKKSENQDRGASEFHGTGGPIDVCNLRYVNELTRAFLAGAQETGIPANSDFNGATQDGAGLHQVTQKNGGRQSAADAYLKPARRRNNLTVLTGCHATRVVVEKNRASGIEYIRRGATEEANAEREVILASGVVNSPQLLLLSGVGPADELKNTGIAPVHDLRGVGKNLQDHPMVSVGYLCEKPVSLASAESVPNFLRWLIFRGGPLASNVAEAGAFVKTETNLGAPDLQILFGPAYYVNHGSDRRKEHCFGFGPTLLAPESRGSVSLRSRDPFEPPAIRANYLSTEHDLRVMAEGVRRSREIAHTKAFNAYRGEELHPGSEVRTTDEVARFVRANTQTLYHPVGTCRMGNDAMAVVDHRLRVRGIERLRVVDASVMPRITSGNTNAPTIMIAEKGADMIREDN